jgi:hypothetical protein
MPPSTDKEQYNENVPSQMREKTKGEFYDQINAKEIEDG